MTRWSRLLRQCLIVAVTLTALPVAAQSVEEIALTKANSKHRNLRLTHLGSADGLTQELVNSIAQDAEGFMWFGTQEGLTRYDGKRMHAYRAAKNTEHGLPHDFIWTMLSDSKGRLWIGTNGGGLALYRPRTDDFRIYKHDPENPNSISSNRVRTLYEDSLGRLWIGTLNGGLDLFDADVGRFESFLPQEDDPGSLPGANVTAISEDSVGNIWIGTEKNGAARFDPVMRTFTAFKENAEDPNALADNAIRNLYSDASGRLWIATDKGGLHQFMSESQSFRRHQHAPDRETSLPSNLVRDVHQDHNGDLWVATDAGLAQWLGGDEFIRYQHDPADRDSLNTNPLTDLYEDANGNLWIGSYDGVDKWNYISDMFTYYDTRSGHLSNELITALAEEADGSLWMGTYGGGLTRYDRAANVVRRYQHDSADSKSLSDDRVMAMALGVDNQLWVGTRGGGLNLLNTKTHQFKRFDYMSSNPQANGISSLLAEADGTVWVGTYGGGLTRIRGDERTFFSHNEKDPLSLSSNKVLSIYRDRSGILWLGTEDGGLNSFNEATEQFSRYSADPTDPTALQSNTAWQVHESSNGSLWIGTANGGLSEWTSEARAAGRFTLKHYRANEPKSVDGDQAADALASDSVLGILEDNQGYLWISSNVGLTRFDPRSGRNRHFDSQNGLRGNEFMMGVSLRSASGNLYFGSSNGVVSFAPLGLKESSRRPPIAITAKSRDQILARGFSADAAIQTIEVAYPYYYLSFDFAALDFVSPDKNEFLYQLSGFENDWIPSVDYPRATYTNLAPGSYDFKVKASNSDGFWNEQGVTIRVRVIPPPWRSNWAYALYVLLTLLIAGSIYRNQRNKFKQAALYQRELENQVQERTQELAAQNNQLADLNEKLTQASLTDPLTGLRNRRYFYEVIKPMTAAIDRHYTQPQLESEKFLYFLMIDLDGFKSINDNYGHHAGDMALSELANLLTAACRETDTVCRWGGDEFLIVGEVNEVLEIERLAERLRATIDANRFEVGDGAVGHMSASIGLCTYPLLSSKPGLAGWETVSKLADQAAYVAKTSGKNRWVRLAGTRLTDGATVLDAHHRAAELVLENKLTLTSSAPVRIERTEANVS